MVDNLGRIASKLADYTIGTVIVLVHVTLADRRSPRRRAGPVAAASAYAEHGTSWEEAAR